jgi:hypothetical protein
MLYRGNPDLDNNRYMYGGNTSLEVSGICFSLGGVSAVGLEDVSWGGGSGSKANSKTLMTGTEAQVGGSHVGVWVGFQVFWEWASVRSRSLVTQVSRPKWCCGNGKQGGQGVIRWENF